MSDNLISRQHVTYTIDKYISGFDAIDANFLDGLKTAKKLIKELSSAQSEHTETHSCDCERTETHDLVSRRAALEAMDTWDKFGCDPDGKLVRYDDDKHYVPYVHYEDMVHAVKNLPSAQRWIPVTEALPEDACQCIVTAKVKHVDNYPDYEVDTADFADGIFTTTNSWWGVESIIAWIPLPEPYKGE